MTEIINSNNSDTIYFYFNTVESKLNIDTFNQMVKSINVVTNDVTKIFFDDKSTCEIYVLPAENGSFKSKFAITVITTASLGLLTNFGDGFIDGLTGHDTKYYGNKCGELVKDATIGIFSKTTEELNKIIPEDLILDSALNAKSNFYLSIINDSNIKSLGFSNNDKTKIQRTNFTAYTSPDIIRDVDNTEEYAKLTIIKPVTVRSSQMWTLKDHSKGRNDDYKILDEEFKNLVWGGGNPLKETEKPDEIIAKIEYVKEMKNGIVSTVETNITDVYKFNDKEIKKLPNDFKLNEPKKKNKTNEVPGQISIWDAFKWEDKEV